MKHTVRLTLLMASAIWLGSAFPVLACSVKHVATPNELVAGADAIYLAKAEDESEFVPGQRRSSISPQVDFTISETLKGPRQTTIQIDAQLVQTADPNDGSVPYSFVRPGGRGGNCFAKTYKRGSEYLLFIKDGTPYWAPLAPANEEVVGPSDTWVVWVRHAVKLLGTRPNNSFKPNPLRGSA